MCDKTEPDAAIASLMKWCEQPFHICCLPGPLELPSVKKGTLFLKDVSHLTLAQQIALNDWIECGRGDLQIASATDTPVVAARRRGSIPRVPLLSTEPDHARSQSSAEDCDRVRHERC